MWKKKKVRAGVLLYAVTIAGIFSLLLQFYLNRQVAHHQDYALNKEKLLAFAMAKRTYEKASSESGVQSFDVGKATYHTDEKGFLKKTEVETEKIGQFMERLAHKAEASKMTSHYQLHLLSQIYELLFLISEVAPDIHRSHPSPTYQLYLTCKHVIETHYNKDHLSIQEIADDLNVHRSYLTTIFKEFHQISPKEFLYSVRMQRAQQLLTNTDESIKIVAYSVGFSDPLYFSKAFKAYSQLTPSQYRSKHKI